MIVAICGPAGSGKTSLAEALERQHGAVHVQAVTTRRPRPGDEGHYEYLTRRQFSQLSRSRSLAVEADYAGQFYGVTSRALRDALESSGLCALTLTPDAALSLASSREFGRLVTTVFLDAPDDTLDARTGDRNDNDARRRARIEERQVGQGCDLVLTGQEPVKHAALVHWVACHKGGGGVLPGRAITLYLDAGLVLRNADPGCVQGASYDLRLGDEYYYGGKILSLSAKRPVLLIEPYDYAIVTSREKADFPRDVCANFDLSVGLFSQGVILSNGPQVDPGFRGTLFCLLFNTSSSPVLMKRGQHYATLVLNRLVEPAEPYHGPRQDKNSIVDYLPANAARGAINDLKKEIEALRRQSLTLQTVFLAAVAVLVAVVAMLLAAR